MDSPWRTWFVTEVRIRIEEDGYPLVETVCPIWTEMREMCPDGMEIRYTLPNGGRILN